MDDTIKIRGGRGKTPELQDKELGYNRDEKCLYIGTPDGNVRLCGADDIAEAINNANRYIDGLMDKVNERLEALEKAEEPEPEPEEPDPPEEGEVNG